MTGKDRTFMVKPMQSKLLQKHGTTAPVVNKPPLDEETRKLLFPTDAEYAVMLQQAIDEAMRGENLYSGEEEEEEEEEEAAELDRAVDSWTKESRRKINERDTP